VERAGRVEDLREDQEDSLGGGAVLEGWGKKKKESPVMEKGRLDRRGSRATRKEGVRPYKKWGGEARHSTSLDHVF